MATAYVTFSVAELSLFFYLVLLNSEEEPVSLPEVQGRWRILV